MARNKFMNNDFIQCCVRWAKSVSPKGNLWYWLLFLPLTGPLISMAGEEAYNIVARLTAVALATLVAIWVSYILRAHFDEDMELALFQQMVEDGSLKGQDRGSILLSRAIMLSSSWLTRAIVLVGFLWAIVVAFRGDYIT